MNDTTQPERLPLTSLDIAAEKREELRRALAATFPEIMAEDRIDLDQLKRVLGEWVEPDRERFGLNWPGKAACMKVIQAPSIGTLKPCPEESVDWDTTQNVFIEGDNLEVLKLLQKAYFGKIKMIYIDPPYNTGKEFIYPDKYSETLDTYLEYTGQKDSDGRKFSTNTDSSGRFHSRWLNMMYPRLYLAKNLLRDDGAIFISIDDNEVCSLKLLCDIVFGEENFRALITRPTGTPTGSGNSGIVNELDYVVVYARSAQATITGLPLTKEEEKIYDQRDEKGRYLTRSLRMTGGEDRREDRPSMFFKITNPDGDDVLPHGPGGYESRWRCSPTQYEALKSDGLIEWKRMPDDNGILAWKPYQKFYLEGRLKQPSNLWDELEGNKKATRDIREIFGTKVFDFPKPVDLVEKCIQISTEDDDIVLDFFEGSGTTAHAVLKVNFERNTRRKFMCVQLPEPCPEGSDARATGFRTTSQVARERIRRVARRMMDASQVKADTGFRAFSLSRSNFAVWDASADRLNDDTLLGACPRIR